MAVFAGCHPYGHALRTIERSPCWSVNSRNLLPNRAERRQQMPFICAFLDIGLGAAL